MENIAYDYGKLIEEIRKSRKMSRNELCENIMSSRNYQRFSNGEVSISHDKIVKLTDRLGLDYFSFSHFVRRKTEDDYSRLVRVHNHIEKWENDKAKIVLATIDKDNLLSERNKFLYRFNEIFLNKNNKVIESKTFYSQIMELIKFPDILEYDIVNEEELNCLCYLNTYFINNGDDKINTYLESIINDRKYIKHMGYESILSVCYTSVAKGYFGLTNYMKCLEICDQGIIHCQTNNLITGLSNLHGYKALAYDQIGEFEMANEEFIKTYMVLSIENNHQKTKAFISTIEKNLKIRIEDLIKIKKKND